MRYNFDSNAWNFSTIDMIKNDVEAARKALQESNTCNSDVIFKLQEIEFNLQIALNTAIAEIDTMADDYDDANLPF